MKIQRLFSAILLTLLTLSASAQVKWLSTEHDFGAFDEDDGKVPATFRFVNTGEEPLYIRHVRSTCGCTVPEYSRLKIMPGDTASVTAVYNPSGRPGRFAKSLVVTLSNDSIQRLHIKGVVIGTQNTVRSRFPLEVGPIRMRGNMLPFGSVKTGKMRSEYIEVYNTSHEPVVAQWGPTPSYLRIVATNDTVRPGEMGVYSFLLTPNADTPYGLLTDSVTYTVPGQEPVNFEIAAIIEEDFSKLSKKQLENAPHISVDTDMLDFGDFTAANTPITRQFTVTNTGKDDLILRRVYTTEKGMTVDAPDLRLKKGRTAVVTVTFDPAGFEAPILNSRLLIIANDPDRPMTTVRLVGIPSNN